MSLTRQLAISAGYLLRDVHAGVDKVASRRLCGSMAPTLAVTSPAFAQGGRLPTSCTADGSGIAPSLRWEDMGGAALSYALICEDPDAPFPQPFVHWLVYDLPGTSTGISASHPGREGRNSLWRPGYTGAAPPFGHGTHHYHFQLFALDVPGLGAASLGRRALLRALDGHVIAWGELIGRYGRGARAHA